MQWDNWPKANNCRKEVFTTYSVQFQILKKLTFSTRKQPLHWKSCIVLKKMPTLTIIEIVLVKSIIIRFPFNYIEKLITNDIEHTRIYNENNCCFKMCVFCLLQNWMCWLEKYFIADHNTLHYHWYILFAQQRQFWTRNYPILGFSFASK